jgi:hypothetical protein
VVTWASQARGNQTASLGQNGTLSRWRRQSAGLIRFDSRVPELAQRQRTWHRRRSQGAGQALAGPAPAAQTAEVLAGVPGTLEDGGRVLGASAPRYIIFFEAPESLELPPTRFAARVVHRRQFVVRHCLDGEVLGFQKCIRVTDSVPGCRSARQFKVLVLIE